jgi:hypothetical protein
LVCGFIVRPMKTDDCPVIIRIIEDMGGHKTEPLLQTAHLPDSPIFYHSPYGKPAGTVSFYRLSGCLEK